MRRKCPAKMQFSHNANSKMSATVRVENLTKVYQTRQRKGLFKSEKSTVEALKGVSMQVYAGEIFGLLGPNGQARPRCSKI